jgi:hypothetical protein
MKIWLDDVREPPIIKGMMHPGQRWKWVKTPLEFIDNVYTNLWFENEIEEISFDHDLGVCADGYICARWLILTYELLGKQLPKLSVHSQNPVGRERLERLFEEVNQ